MSTEPRGCNQCNYEVDLQGQAKPDVIYNQVHVQLVHPAPDKVGVLSVCVCVSVHREPPWLSVSGDFKTKPQHDPEDGETKHSDAAETSAASTQQHPGRHTHTHTQTHRAAEFTVFPCIKSKT